MQRKIRVAVLFGGRSAEHEVSLQSARNVIEAIDEAEVMNAPERMEAITQYIAAHHDRKTHRRQFNAIFCVSGIPSVIQYYETFARLKANGGHDLKIATIFSYQANEEDQDAAFPIRDDEVELHVLEEADAPYRTKHSRDHLETFIGDYNKEFGTNYTTRDTQSFYNYYNDVAKRMKNGQIDVLLVVNMFLTGFDSPSLNTLYVDKNLKHHGLIQAFSRTNRLFGEVKSQGNIVCFRNLKENTDEAVAMFANKNPTEEIILDPYEEYVRQFNESFVEMIQIAPSVNSVTQLADEEEELKFVKTFRNLMRLLNVLGTFTEFTFDDLSMSEQQFVDYKSKYLDLYDKVKMANAQEQVSILNDIDFELELIHRDEINVTYILRLLAELKEAPLSEQASRKKTILDLLSGETELRSKRELIEQFIENNLPHIDDPADIPEEFDVYWQGEQVKAFKKLADDEGLDFEKLEKLVGDYLFTSKKPRRDDVVQAMDKKPGLTDRASTAERVINKIYEFIDTFICGSLSD